MTAIEEKLFAEPSKRAGPSRVITGRQLRDSNFADFVTELKKAFITDYVVLGGGLVHQFTRLSKGIERGRNENAFLGGKRLWETKPRSRELKWRLL